MQHDFHVEQETWSTLFFAPTLSKCTMLATQVSRYQHVFINIVAVKDNKKAEIKNSDSVWYQTLTRTKYTLKSRQSSHIRHEFAGKNLRKNG